MARGLQALLAGLAGAGRAGVDYYGQKRETERVAAEREAERQRLQDQFDKQMQLSLDNAAGIAEERDYNRTRTNYLDENPDTDLTASPNLAKYEKFGLGLNRTPATAAPKLSDSITLPSMPSYELSAPPGGAASTPMPEGKYDPNADAPPDVPAAPAMKALTVATPTYGLGAPGKVTRTETRQEAQQRIQREAMLSTFNATLADPRAKDPAVRAMIEGQIRQLEQGGDPTMSESELVTSLRLGNQPTAGADKDIIDPRVRGELAAALNADPSMIPERWSELPKGAHDAYAAWEKKNRGVDRIAPPIGWTVRDGINYQQALTKRDNRPEITDYREMGRYLGSIDTAMAEIGTSNSYIAVDQALINAFNKLNDPSSVVRESEYKRTADDQSVLNRLRGLVGPDGKLAMGGAGLTQMDREAIARMSRAFYAAAQNRAADAYEDVARDYDRMVTGDGTTIGDAIRANMPERPIKMVKMKHPTNGTIIEVPEAEVAEAEAAGAKRIGGA